MQFPQQRNKIPRKWRNLPHLLQHVGRCGKVRHPDQVTAEAEANRLASIFTLNQTFTVHRCTKCYWWHVTSNRYSPPRNQVAARSTAARRDRIIETLRPGFAIQGCEMGCKQIRVGVVAPVTGVPFNKPKATKVDHNPGKYYGNKAEPGTMQHLHLHWLSGA